MVALFILMIIAIAASAVSREMRNRNSSMHANMLSYHGILHGCSGLHRVTAAVHEPDPDGDFADMEAAKKQWNVKSPLFHVEVEGARRLHAQGLQWQSPRL